MARYWLVGQAGEMPYDQAASCSPGLTMSTPLLAVQGVKKYFPVTTGLLRRRTAWVQAVSALR